MNGTHYFDSMKSPLGEIVLTASDEGLTGLYTPEHPDYSQAKRGKRDPKLFRQAQKQLKEYFDGKRSQFDVPIASRGTQFQMRVWKALRGIRFGETRSYGEVAKSLRAPQASRAVGSANGKNPVCIIVPCHRVIGADGRLSGYAGGVKAKRWLLEHESKFSAQHSLIP